MNSVFSQWSFVPSARCHTRTITTVSEIAGHTEGELPRYPTPDELWKRTFATQNVWRDRFAAVPFEDKGGSHPSRYYQDIAVEQVMKAIAEKRQRILLTLASGISANQKRSETLARRRRRNVKFPLSRTNSIKDSTTSKAAHHPLRESLPAADACEYVSTRKKTPTRQMRFP
jgi:hypothetical protein